MKLNIIVLFKRYFICYCIICINFMSMIRDDELVNENLEIVK